MRGLERWELIYNQISGLCELDVCEWVKDETAEDGELWPVLKQAYDARSRVAERLGVDPSGDKDLAQLADSFEAFARACGKLMYRYGYQDGTTGELKYDASVLELRRRLYAIKNGTALLEEHNLKEHDD